MVENPNHHNPEKDQSSELLRPFINHLQEIGVDPFNLAELSKYFCTATRDLGLLNRPLITVATILHAQTKTSVEYKGFHFDIQTRTITAPHLSLPALLSPIESLVFHPMILFGGSMVPNHTLAELLLQRPLLYPMEEFDYKDELRQQIYYIRRKISDSRINGKNSRFRFINNYFGNGYIFDVPDDKNL